MNAEEVAEKFNRRAGMDLISYREVALPIWRIGVRALIAEEKPLAPFDEFVLRAIDEGFAAPTEMSSILGLDETLVVNVAADLMRHDCLYHAPVATGGATLMLTTKGRTQLADAVSIKPAEQQLPVDFDALKWKLVPSGEWYLKPKEVQDSGLIELPRAKKRAPEIDDLRLQDVDAIIKAGSARTRTNGRLLALKAIESRHRMYRHAVALIYRGASHDDIQVDFAVDGVIEPELAQCFSTENLFSRLGIDRRAGIKLASVDLAADLRSDGVTLTRGLTEAIAKPVVVERAPAPQESEPEAASASSEPAPAPVEADAPPLPAMVESPKSKAKSKAKSVAPVAATAPPASLLSCYEHPAYLQDALRTSTRRLMIISPWVKRMVVNDAFVKKLEGCLEQGVDVFIGWGIEKLTKDDEDIDFNVKKVFDTLTKRYPNAFHARRLGGTHAKILISDSHFAVITSFNWLSFRGDPDRTVRDERGTVVRTREEIESLFSEYRAKFP